MEIRKEEAIALAFLLFLVSSLLALSAASALPHNEAPPQCQDLDGPPIRMDHSDFKLQLDHFQSKILTLVSSIDNKTKELKHKDRAISNLEKTIQQKSEKIASLQNDNASLQKKLAFDVSGKANAKTVLLEEQIDALKKEIESQKKKRDRLEINLLVAEYKIGELSAKLESTQKTSDEQKKRIQEIEHALKAAEKWMLLKTYTEPYIQLAWYKSVEWYETAKIITAPPSILKVIKILDLYMDRSAELSRVYFEKLLVLMMLYTDQAMEIYTSFLKSVATYCLQAPANIWEYKHKLTKKLTTKEHVWFTASALLALTFFLYHILSQLFCMNKPRKQIRNSHGNHRARRHKRRHAVK